MLSEVALEVFFVLPEGAQTNPPRLALQSIVFTSDFERRVWFANYSIDLWIDRATEIMGKSFRANLTQQNNTRFVFRWGANSHLRAVVCLHWCVSQRPPSAI